MLKKVLINQLLPGMRVVKLDVGWENFPHSNGAFVINNAEDIVNLHSHCKTVLIEVAAVQNESESQPAEPDHSKPQEILSASTPATTPTPQPHSARDSLRAKISEQMVTASYRETLETLCVLFNQIRAGETFDEAPLQNCVRSLLLSTAARPETLSLLSQLTEKDNSLERKSLDVAVLSLTFGRFLGMKNDALQQLGMAALLHDVGMLKVPEELLSQKEQLSVGQRLQIQKHVEYGCYILGVYPQLKPLIGIIAYHHERYDGTGYPAGLRGKRIPLPSRILHLTTTFEALTRNRHFSEQSSTTNALSKIYSWRNQAVDAPLVEKFIKAIGIYPIGTLVQLSDRRIGIVTALHERLRSRPKLKPLFDASGSLLNERGEIDLSHIEHQNIKINRALEAGKVPLSVFKQIGGLLGLDNTSISSTS